MPKANGNGNGEYKLSNERRLTAVETNMNAIMNNHLPHLQVAVDSVDEKVDKLNLTIARWIGGGAVIILIAQGIFSWILSR